MNYRRRVYDSFARRSEHDAEVFGSLNACEQTGQPNARRLKAFGEIKSVRRCISTD